MRVEDIEVRDGALLYGEFHSNGTLQICCGCVYRAIAMKPYGISFRRWEVWGPHGDVPVPVVCLVWRVRYEGNTLCAYTM